MIVQQTHGKTRQSSRQLKEATPHTTYLTHEHLCRCSCTCKGYQMTREGKWRNDSLRLRWRHCPSRSSCAPPPGNFAGPFTSEAALRFRNLLHEFKAVPGLHHQAPSLEARASSNNFKTLHPLQILVGCVAAEHLLALVQTTPPAVQLFLPFSSNIVTL